MSEPWQELGGLPAHPVEDDTPPSKRLEHFVKPLCPRCKNSSPPGFITEHDENGDEVIMARCPCRLSKDETGPAGVTCIGGNPRAKTNQRRKNHDA